MESLASAAAEHFPPTTDVGFRLSALVVEMKSIEAAIQNGAESRIDAGNPDLEHLAAIISEKIGRELVAALRTLKKSPV